jgi:enoyl-CoA hydratase/carnithine racemase
MATIAYEERNSVALITIDNQRKRNAFTHEMTKAMGRHLLEAERNPAIRCVVITGAGDAAFSSGHDLQEMLADVDHASDPSLNDPFLLPSRMTTPTIAAVNGFAFAAGFILSIACDFRVCAQNASFAAPGARIGLLPIGGQLSRLPTLIPRSVAHELLVTCREMKADEALRLGFANRVVPQGQALESALEMAGQIAANSAGVVRAIKTGLEAALTDGATAAQAYEWRVAAQLQHEPDAQEGIRAFLEKRSPRFV